MICFMQVLHGLEVCSGDPVGSHFSIQSSILVDETFLCFSATASFKLLMTSMLIVYWVLVWCDMSEICLKLKVLAKIDFIIFLTLLGVK